MTHIPAPKVEQRAGQALQAAENRRAEKVRKRTVGLSELKRREQVEEREQVSEGLRALRVDPAEWAARRRAMGR